MNMKKKAPMLETLPGKKKKKVNCWRSFAKISTEKMVPHKILPRLLFTLSCCVCIYNFGTFISAIYSRGSKDLLYWLQVLILDFLAPTTWGGGGGSPLFFLLLLHPSFLNPYWINRSSFPETNVEHVCVCVCIFPIQLIALELWKIIVIIIFSPLLWHWN